MILITGASGFVGSAVARMAARRGIPIRAMVRASSRRDLLEGVPRESIVEADMTDADALRRAAAGVDAVVHCAATTSSMAPDMELSWSVNVEGTERLLKACRDEGVRRFINISSQSAHPDNPSVYGKTKLEQDKRVKAAPDIDWTILKPSIIYGAEAKGIFDKMVDYCRKLPVIPIIGPGREEMRPIHVDDLADAILACIETPTAIGKTYDLGGADVLPFNDFIKEILGALGRSKPLFHLPIPIALAMAKTLSALMANPPLTPDNVTGIQTAPHVDIDDARRDFGFSPRSFREGLRDIYGRESRGDPRKAEQTEQQTEQTVTEPGNANKGDSPVRVAVIGLGKMGVMHASMCTVVPGCEVAALVDQDVKLGGQVRSMGVDAPVFSSLEEALASGAPIDAAIVATPQFTHRAIGCAALDAGLHVFCEKPLAHTLEDARAMAEKAAACAGSDPNRVEQVAAIGFMKGHYPLWLEAARRLSAGWIGEPRRFRASVYLSQVLGPRRGWTFTKEKAGGGVLINTGIHLVHFLHVLFGPAERVFMRGRPMHSAVEDTLCGVLEFETGVFGSYDASWSVPGYQTEGTTVLVESDEGTMEITDDWVRVFHLSGKGEAPKGWSRMHRSETDRADFTMSPDYGGEGYYNQIEDFARAIREKKPPRYDWSTGLAVQRLVDAMYRSMESGAAEKVEG